MIAGRNNPSSSGFAATAAALIAIASLTLAPAAATAQLTTPEEQFGYRLGTDYQLVNYEGLTDYWHLLAQQSDRMSLESIGQSEEGREQWMATITSPANRPNLDRYKEIARRLAHAEDVTEEEARALAAEGKAVIWIDGGLHATEVLGVQQLMELVWQMVSLGDAETMRFLDDVILLVTHANPDGHALVANWYMRHDDPMERTTQGVPVLYNKYAGHDNNRDFYMASLSETENMNRVIYREWFPQIVYNHHQTGPQGTVMFAPPFRDPPNHNLDPIIITSLDQVGSAMHHRMVVEGKGGTTMRRGASYSTWWNGGLRTTPYFHNMIGLLTETIGNPTPVEIPFLPNRQISHADLPLPVTPGLWYFRQSIDYSQTANRAVLDYASRNREHLLFNIWRMGTNSIERGGRDSWTILPMWIDRLADEVGQRASQEDYDAYLRDPAKRDARGYILPADQSSFATATRFVNALLKNGVTVHQATDDFSVAGKDYPAGSYVVTAAQAFRPHVIDMFEPQNHPDDFQYPGGPPIAPYDNAGWTLALQMGVEFDRILDGFSGPFQPIEWLADPMPGTVAGADSPAGYMVDHENAAFTAVNRVLASGGQVHWVEETFDAAGMSFAPGAFYIPAAAATRSQLEEWAAQLGVSLPRRGDGSRRDIRADPRAGRSLGPLRRLHAVRVDPSHPGRLRVQLRGDLPGGHRRGRAERPFRRDHPARRRHERRARRRRQIRRRPRRRLPGLAAGLAARPGGLPVVRHELPRPARVRRERRRGGRHRDLDRAGHRPRPPPRRLHGGRRRQPAQPGRLLHPRVDPRHPRRARQPDHPRPGRARERPAQPQPRLPDRGQRPEREAAGVVRLPRTAVERVGRGASSIWKAARA